ncbi:L-2-hydroxyglutarate oxidase [Planctomyces sp. SH-PL14]|uniref:L-2-hydroxyglutarate oxidase n=1 Tax=Planctomyces sp. SH-PL14 TaxID=1632864 RepID=UPI00078C923E|nr:L-2-hydroxyglutarate oxidase [Planctomyces sp. SH-PL14]AMV17354.1 L-2-hydroxyglutarate oxidase LhgO [Planctomyces sp. SH-PL14]
MPDFFTDVAIVGGGIVGLATAFQLLRRFSGTRVVVLEKEDRVAPHQSSHNSGVLHTGIYYRPGSLRAQNCRAGKLAMQAFCDQEEIPYRICGKVIVAVSEAELPQLDVLFQRGQANGVRCSMLTQEELREIEPHTAGIRAIHVPEAGIVDYPAVSRRLAERIQEVGGTIRLGARVTAIRESSDRIIIESTKGAVESRFLMTCAGLHADRVTKLSGRVPEAPIVPFRGEYYQLVPEAEHLCRGLIYPVPDPKFPFLGVHFTRMIHGGVDCGPNAVLAFAREGYRRTDLNPADLWEALAHPGFRRLALRNWRTGAGEMWRSWNKAAFVKALQRLVPAIQAKHLIPAPAGVRAQALRLDGTLVDDFVIQQSGRVVNVGNAPSPAATSSLNIGNLLVDRLAPQLEETRS